MREAGLVCLHACEAPSGQREGEVGKMTAMIPSSLPKAMWTKRIIESHSSNQTHTFLAPIMSTDSVATAALSSPVWKHSGSHTWTCNLRGFGQIIAALPLTDWSWIQAVLQLAQNYDCHHMPTYICGQYSRVMHYEVRGLGGIYNCQFRWGWIEVFQSPYNPFIHASRLLCLTWVQYILQMLMS